MPAYIIFLALVAANLEPLVWSAAAVPTAWPKGTYGLPMPDIGCPDTHLLWKVGARYHDTQDLFPDNDWSSPLDLRGPYYNNNMQQNFCMKTDSETDASDPDWEPGQYCIFKKGNFCPTGFDEGWIKWDDQDSNNQNSASGELPEGEYDQNTKIYFCCREDGLASSPIALPVDGPFFLFRKNEDCQSVTRMTIYEEWFKWDGEDDAIDLNKYRDGSIPDLKNKSGDDHKLMYCYYY